MGSEVSQDETLSPGQGSWIASGSVGEIRSGVQRAVSIVLVSECVPHVLLLAGGQLLRLSSCTLAVELPRSGARLFWWRRGTQCQWKRWGWPMLCLQVWNLRSESFGGGLPVSAGISLVLITASRGLMQRPRFGVVL